MLSVRLTTHAEQKLNEISKITKRPKSFFVKEALDQYLEDLADTYIALDRISEPNRTFLSTQELIKEINKN